MSCDVNSSALLGREPDLPDHHFAWLTSVCHIFGKSPMYIAVLLNHRPGEFCWVAAMHADMTPEVAVAAFRHHFGRKVPDGDPRQHYLLNVQVDYARA